MTAWRFLPRFAWSEFRKGDLRSLPGVKAATPLDWHPSLRAKRSNLASLVFAWPRLLRRLRLLAMTGLNDCHCERSEAISLHLLLRLAEIASACVARLAMTACRRRAP